jgi:hypothetical protein
MVRGSAPSAPSPNLVIGKTTYTSADGTYVLNIVQSMVTQTKERIVKVTLDKVVTDLDPGTIMTGRFIPSVSFEYRVDTTGVGKSSLSDLQTILSGFLTQTIVNRLVNGEQ